MDPSDGSVVHAGAQISMPELKSPWRSSIHGALRERHRQGGELGIRDAVRLLRLPRPDGVHEGYRGQLQQQQEGHERTRPWEAEAA
jgi:hypothetical protein